MSEARATFLFLTLLACCLSACAPAADETAPISSTPSASVTITAAPSSTPTNTALPTSTPTPAPQPISSSNAARLQLAEIVDLDWKHIGDPLAGEVIFRRIEGQSVHIPLSTGKPIHVIWTLDGSALLVETSLGIDILDGSTLELVRQLEATRMLNALDSGAVAALQGNELVFMTLTNGNPVRQWTLDDPSVAMGVSPDGRHLAYATGARTFDLVDLVSGVVLNLVIERQISPVRIMDIIFSPDSAAFFVVHTIPFDGSQASLRGVRAAHLYGVESGRQFYEIMVKSGPVFAADGSYAYTEGTELTMPIRIAHPTEGYYWELVDGFIGGGWSRSHGCSGSVMTAVEISVPLSSNELAVLYEDWDWFLDSSCSRVEHRVFRRTLVLFDTDEGMRQIRQTTIDGSFPIEFGMSPTGQTFFTIAADGVVRLWGADTFEVLQASEQYAHAGPISISPSGTLLAFPYRSHFELRDAQTLEFVDSIPYPHGTLIDEFLTGKVAFLTDTLLSVAVTYQGQGGSAAFTYDLETGSYIATFFPPAGNDLSGCSYSTNGLAMTCWAGAGETTLLFREVYDTVTGNTLVSHDYINIDSFALSNDGTQFAYCNQDASYISFGPFAEAPDYIRLPCQDMLFMPGDQRMLLVDGTIVDLESQEAIGAFMLPEQLDHFPAYYFSPNGDFALIGRSIYDTQSGALLANLDIQSDIYGFFLSADSLRLILITDRGMETWIIL